MRVANRLCMSCCVSVVEINLVLNKYDLFKFFPKYYYCNNCVKIITHDCLHVKMIFYEQMRIGRSNVT